MSNITMELIQQLRERTGVGMMDCKKALIESQGDIEAAIDILRKKGAALAQKRSANTTAEGLIHAYIHPGANVGVMLEINCETDFVARTEDIKKFAQDICLHIAAFSPRCVSPDEVDQTLVERERGIFREQLIASGKPEKMIDQIVESKIKKMREEIALLTQPFVKNDKVTVDDTLKELIAKMGENIKIKRFARFEVGA